MTCDDCKNSTNVFELSNFRGRWLCCDCFPGREQKTKDEAIKAAFYAVCQPATDGETVVNAAGGKQSKIAERPTLLPPRATLAVSAVLTAGAAKYGESNWHLISTNEHLDHALRHIFKYLANDATESHLSHAACRLLMALEVTYV